MCILKLYVPTFKNQTGSEQDLQNTGMAKLSHTQCTMRPIELEIPRYFCPVFFSNTSRAHISKAAEGNTHQKRQTSVIRF